MTRKQLITMVNDYVYLKDDNNPLDFLMEPYDDKKFENELFVINKKVNIYHTWGYNYFFKNDIFLKTLLI